jgi:hypothetical protein
LILIDLRLKYSGDAPFLTPGRTSH